MEFDERTEIGFAMDMINDVDTAEEMNTESNSSSASERNDRLDVMNSIREPAETNCESKT